MLAVGGIDEADQILGAELMVDVGDLDLADGDRLRIVGIGLVIWSSARMVTSSMPDIAAAISRSCRRC